MPTKSPLPVLAIKKKGPPGPKLVGPVIPVYVSTSTSVSCPVCINPKFAPMVPGVKIPDTSKVSPVKLMAPLPVATTFAPTSLSLTV